MDHAPKLPLKLARIDLRISETDLHAWRAAAVREKQKLSEWIRRACDERLAADLSHDEPSTKGKKR